MKPRKHHRPATLLLPVLYIVLLLLTPAAAIEIAPFNSSNRSPLIQIFGLPSPGSPTILASGETELLLALDSSSIFAISTCKNESILLDGETYRIGLALRYGLGNHFEAGLEIPFIGFGGGIFDSSIEGWHDTWGMPNGNRGESPRNRLLFSYKRNDKELLRLDDSNFGIGDLRITAGYHLYRGDRSDATSVALRSSLKLPTGDSGKLHGSGSFDAALWLSAGNSYRLPSGDFSLFGSGGAIAMSRGDILPEQQRSLAGFAGLGAGWAPADWISFIVQLSGHSPLYQGSELKELSASSLQLHTGGSLMLPSSLQLDIDVAEDIKVDTAPDITLHLAIRRKF